MQTLQTSSKKETTIRLYEQIRADYTVWSKKMKNGVKMYTVEYILSELGAKYFKSPKTIENIVFYRV